MIFDLLHDLNEYDQICSCIIETIFKKPDLSRYSQILFAFFFLPNQYLSIVSSYDCLVSMKIEKLLDILNETSFGAYLILKLLFKNRQSFIKVHILRDYKNVIFEFFIWFILVI